jgi:O-antigen/teichoic acid export membrane protein
MKARFFHDLSANALQVVINQICGLFVFYILSTCLSKNEFGEINWSLEVLLTIFSILSFGIDQVSVKRIASGQDEGRTLSLYLFHVLLWGLMVYGLLFAGWLGFQPFFLKHQLLLFLGLGKLAIFFSTPFKQLAIGKEKFRPLLFMSVASNVVRLILLLNFLFIFRLDLTLVIIVFITTDVVELMVSVFITKYVLKVKVEPRMFWNEYAMLVAESLPQLGVTIFTSAIARFDWIFLGLMGSAAILAEYSFAYKVFEMATLPLLVIAPLLIPRLTRQFSRSGSPGEPLNGLSDLGVLMRLEMAIASFTGLVLTLVWVPVIEELTDGKYGFVNRHTILILSACLPFLYFNNLLWTINFAKGRLKMIFYIFAVIFLVNISADVLLIPVWKGEGAALAFLLAIACQSVLYCIYTRPRSLLKNSYSLFLCPTAAFLGGFLATRIFERILPVLLCSFLFYFLMLVLSLQIRRSDWPVFKRVTGF